MPSGVYYKASWRFVHGPGELYLLDTNVRGSYFLEWKHRIE
jgi:hypothetical protein